MIKLQFRNWAMPHGEVFARFRNVCRRINKEVENGESENGVAIQNRLQESESCSFVHGFAEFTFDDFEGFVQGKYRFVIPMLLNVGALHRLFNPTNCLRECV